ncbi:MAG: cytochrome c oxidase accessory protein CcoG [Pseudomonadota bacterium]|nr:cytochrome c oxidase accessory protein CcoG [Pseudomonadota bacterium]
MVWVTQLVFYGTPWLTWNGRQAVLFDIEARRFHLFGLVLWPQDFILLTGLLVCCALALFMFTAVAGRLWCGYACPQTVYTSIFLWIERKTEGEWTARRKRDAGSRNIDWWRHKLAKHGAWIAFSIWTGFTFVGFFTPIRTLAHSFTSFTMGPWETFWVAFYGFATYGNAGWMREQVCKYMCPYARFQGVMMDAGTLTVTYDAVRGEPRGGRSRKADPRAAGLGDCVDCNQCVQVCPTGIDIRRGLQIDCINCGLCVDACNGIMEHLGYPRSLISYTSEDALRRRYSAQVTANPERAPLPYMPDSKGSEAARVITTAMINDAARADLAGTGPRVHLRRLALYGSLLTVVTGAIVVALVVRVPVRLDVMRDRSVLARDTDSGMIENVYRLQIVNMSEHPRSFRLSVTGPESVAIHGGTELTTVPALGSALVAIDVDADPGRIPHPRFPITLQVQATDSSKVVARSETQFFSR